MLKSFDIFILLYIKIQHYIYAYGMYTQVCIKPVKSILIQLIKSIFYACEILSTKLCFKIFFIRKISLYLSS